MKKNLRLKFLIGLTFVVFALPFFDACTGKVTEESSEASEIIEEDNKETIELKENIIKDTILEEVIEEDSLINTIEDNKREENYFQKKETTIYNAYELSYLMILDGNIMDYDKTTLIVLIILVVVINSLIMLVLAFKNRIKNIYKIGIFSLILAIIWYINILILDENINQIKYGYYIYLMNIILIILENIRILKKE